MGLFFLREEGIKQTVEGVIHLGLQSKEKELQSLGARLHAKQISKDCRK